MLHNLQFVNKKVDIEKKYHRDGCCPTINFAFDLFSLHPL